MKTQKIKITVVEDGYFYKQVIQQQIQAHSIISKSSLPDFEVQSISSISDLKKDLKNNYQVIVFDNHFKNNQQKVNYNVTEIIDEIKLKNNNCFFISISGYREMNVMAYMYKQGELVFSYSKQSAVRNESHEEKCAIPALNKLTERFIEDIANIIRTAAQLKAA